MPFFSNFIYPPPPPPVWSGSRPAAISQYPHCPPNPLTAQPSYSRVPGLAQRLGWWWSYIIQYLNWIFRYFLENLRYFICLFRTVNQSLTILFVFISEITLQKRQACQRNLKPRTLGSIDPLMKRMSSAPSSWIRVWGMFWGFIDIYEDLSIFMRMRIYWYLWGFIDIYEDLLIFIGDLSDRYILEFIEDLFRIQSFQDLRKT